MKNLMIDPRVREIMDNCRAQLEKLQEEKDDEIEEFLEEHAEAKFKAVQQAKKAFQLKIAFAQKSKDDDKEQKVKELEEARANEIKQVEKEMQEKSNAGKNKIKDRYNELAA